MPPQCPHGARIDQATPSQRPRAWNPALSPPRSVTSMVSNLTCPTGSSLSSHLAADARLERSTPGVEVLTRRKGEQ